MEEREGEVNDHGSDCGGGDDGFRCGATPTVVGSLPSDRNG